MGEQARVTLRVRGKRVVNVIGGHLAVDQVLRVEIADVVAVEDVVDVLFLVDRKDVPVLVDGASGGTEDDFAAGVGRDPVCDVVDFGASDNPFGVRAFAVGFDVREADGGSRW